MGPVYKIIDARTNTIRKENVMLDQFVPQKTIVNTSENYVLNGKQTDVIKAHPDIIKQFDVKPLETISEDPKQGDVTTDFVKTYGGKRNRTGNLGNRKRKRTKQIKMESMVLHHGLMSEGEESNSSNMLFYQTDMYSSPSTDNPQSTRSSISSDHDYIYVPENWARGVEPIKFADPYLTEHDKPYIEIVVQPQDMFRFRYISEMNGMHGSILGKSTNSEKSRKKTFPTVKLHNYPKKAFIMCTLIQNDVNILNFHPHCLSLRGENDQANIEDPLEKLVRRENNHTICYQGLAIVHTAKKKVGTELYRKRVQLYKMSNQPLTKRDDYELKISCETLARNTNMNSVRFLFVAFDAETRQQICTPVYTDPVSNLKSAETGALKISRMSKHIGSVYGGDEVFMFVEKVSKKNIKIRFFELNNDERTWEAYAKFLESDVHHQYGIVFTTPPYKTEKIQEEVKVFVELVRPKDDVVSAASYFVYKPCALHNKRRRKAENSSNILSSLDSNYSSEMEQISAEIPITVVSMSDSQHNPSSDLLRLMPTSSLDRIDRHDLIMNTQIDSLELNNYNFSMESTKDIFISNKDPCLSEGRRIAVDGVSPSKSDAAPASIVPSEDVNSVTSFPDNFVFECASFEPENNELYCKPDIEAISKIAQEMNSLSKLTSAEAAQLALKIVEWRAFCGDYLQHILVTMKQQKIFNIYLDMIKTHNLGYCLNYGNKKGETALHTAVKFFMHDFVGKLLLAGCDPNILDDEGNSPLHLSVKENNSDCMVQLLRKSNYDQDSSHSLKVDIPNGEGWTALHMAAVRGALVSVSRLLRANADPNIKGEDTGRTALHLAVMGGHLTLVNYLLDYPNVEIDAEGKDGETPLHIACTSDNHGANLICESLLNAGADATKIYRNSSPIDLVKRSGVPEIYEVFQRKFPHIFKEPFIKKELEDYSNAPSPACDEPSNNPSNSSRENTPNPDGDFVVKEEPKDYQFMDTNTTKLVVESLQKSGRWKDLAINLGYGDFVEMQSASQLKNPSGLLLNLLEVQEKVSLSELQEELQKLNLEGAAKAVQAIIKK